MVSKILNPASANHMDSNKILKSTLFKTSYENNAHTTFSSSLSSGTFHCHCGLVLQCDRRLQYSRNERVETGSHRNVHTVWRIVVEDMSTSPNRRGVGCEEDDVCDLRVWILSYIQFNNLIFWVFFSIPKNCEKELLVKH